MSINRSKTEETLPLLKAIDNICSYTEYSISSRDYVKQAFMLGLWHKAFPDYMLEHIERTTWWMHTDEFGEAPAFDISYENLMKFQFISETGDSWHQCYRDLRELGWQRLKVHRAGGILSYLLINSNEALPQGYQTIHLVLSISISTCRRVQVGIKTIEQPIFETHCEDLVELPDDQEAFMGHDDPASSIDKIAADVFNKDYDRFPLENQIADDSEPSTI